MHSLLRAGLVHLLVGLFALTVSAAPISHYTSVSASAISVLAPIGVPANIGNLHPLLNADIPDNAHGLPPAIRPIAPTILTTVSVAVREEEMVTLYRRNKFTDFFKHVFHKIGEGFHKMADGIKHVAQKIGDGIKHVAQKVGDGIKHVAQKIGSGIKHVALKIADGVKTAAQKVGHFIKTTGAKIAKVGLKILATVHKAVSKVVGWLPGIGKPIARVMDAEAEGEDKLSDKIKVHIGGKLGHAMDNMSKAQKIMGYIPRELQDAIDQKHAVRQLSERELHSVNLALAARDKGAEHALLEREWDEGKDSDYN